MSSGAAVFVIGPAGTGKSTLCGILGEHCAAINRSTRIINLDPAAEFFSYTPSKDIRDVIEVKDAMKQCKLGPNGALVACMEYLLENIDWLEEDLGQYTDEFIIVDCPGQIELYTHYNIVPKLVQTFQQQDYGVVVLYLMESNFLLDVGKYIGAVLNATAAMLNVGAPHLNVITKLDLIEGKTELFIDGSETNPSDNPRAEVDQEDVDDNYEDELHPLHHFFYPNPQLLLEKLQMTNPGYLKLNQALTQLLDEYDIVSFIGLNIRREGSIQRLVAQIDHAVQYGEQLEPKEPEETIRRI